MATPTTSVPGIGKATAFALSQHGFRSAEALAAADEGVLAAVPGFGVSRAARVIESARKLIGVSVAEQDAAPAEAVSTDAVEIAEAPAKGKKGGAAKTKNKKKGKKKAGKSKEKKGSKQKKTKGEKKSGKAGKSKKAKKNKKKSGK